MKFSTTSLAMWLVLVLSSNTGPGMAFTSTANTQQRSLSSQQGHQPLFASTLDKAETTKSERHKINGSNDSFDDDLNYMNSDRRSRIKGNSNKKNKSPPSLSERITSSGVASAAAMATAAVNAAVSMKSLEAPDVAKSYIALDKSGSASANNELDEEGLPRVYDKDLIEKYWAKERGALNRRWGQFVSKTVPFLTKMTTLFIRDGKIDEKEIPALSRQARLDLQDLGATFIKAGQMMSV